MYKSISTIGIATLFAMGSIAIVGCGNSKENHGEEAHEDKHDEEHTHQHSKGEEHFHEHATEETHEHTAAKIAHKHGGEDHAHGSPHGGVVKTAGDYHIEQVVGEGKVSYYLLDGAEKSITNKDVTGTVILQFSDETISDKLSPEGDGHFTLELKEGASSFTSIVSFVVNEKTVIAKFPKESHDDHGHKHENHGGHGHQH